jgi:hypothetical protein
MLFAGNDVQFPLGGDCSMKCRKIVISSTGDLPLTVTATAGEAPACEVIQFGTSEPSSGDYDFTVAPRQGGLEPVAAVLLTNWNPRLVVLFVFSK